MYQGIDKDGHYLVDMIYAPAYTKLCMAALDMDIFSQLQEPKTASKLAEQMDWHTENTGYFLDALVGILLLTKEDGCYKNTAISNKYLVPDKERFMGDFMQMYVGLSGFEQTDFAALVKDGPNAVNEEQPQNISFAEQIHVMRKGQSGERSYEAVTFLKTLPEFKNAKRLLDLGCGTGMLGIGAAQANPDLQVILFDTPQMKEGIIDSITQSGLAERVTAVGGDYLNDDIGESYDIIMAFATLNFARPVLVSVMQKLHQALNPNGVLIIASDGISADGTLPADMVAGWLPYTMKGMDFRMPSGVTPNAALAAGFKHVHTTTALSCSGNTEIHLIRK